MSKASKANGKGGPESLLPSSAASFSARAYWDEFYRQRKTAFEWYGDWPGLQPHLHPYLKETDSILHVGCGNSELGPQLFDQGFRRVTNLDNAEDVVRKMAAKHAKPRPAMHWVVQDATKTNYPDGHFHVVLDKGTLDALYPPPKAEEEASAVPDTVLAYFNEMGRVVRDCGRWVTVSLAQPHLLGAWADFCRQQGTFLLRVLQIQLPAEDGPAKLPVFALIATKLRKPPPGVQLPQVVEFSAGEGARAEKMAGVEDLCDRVAAAQEFSLFAHRCRQGGFAGGEQPSVVLCGSNGLPRYTLHVVERLGRHSGRYGCFIVPQGRETEFQFGTAEGRADLAAQAQCSRLTVACLHRAQTYSKLFLCPKAVLLKDLEDVKTELGTYVRAFAPPDASGQIPYMSVGAEGVGQRRTVEKGSSALSGDYLVEEVLIDGEWLRRLVFLDSPDTCQSEVGLGRDGAPNVRRLHSDYQEAFLASLAFIGALRGPEDSGPSLPDLAAPLDVLVLGVGGGGLSSFLRSALPASRVTGLELDEEVVGVARRWFGLPHDDPPRLRVQVGDAAEFVASTAAAVRGKKSDARWDLVLVDLAGPREEDALKAPPPHFLSEGCLADLRLLCAPSGCVALNVMTRSGERLAAAEAALAKTFPARLSSQAEAHLNRVFLCFPEPAADLVKSSKARLSALSEAFATSGQGPPKGSSRKGKKRPQREDADLQVLADSLAHLVLQ